MFWLRKKNEDKNKNSLKLRHKRNLVAQSNLNREKAEQYASYGAKATRKLTAIDTIYTGQRNYRFHEDPDKAWNYYAFAARAELHDIIQLQQSRNTKQRTTLSALDHSNSIKEKVGIAAENNSDISCETSTTHSTWDSIEESITIPPKEVHPSKYLVYDDKNLGDREFEFFLTPEGINRTPFAVWEVDLIECARLASYFVSQHHQLTHQQQPRSSSVPKNGCKMWFAPYRTLSFPAPKCEYAATPLNSPNKS